MVTGKNLYLHLITLLGGLLALRLWVTSEPGIEQGVAALLGGFLTVRGASGLLWIWRNR
jgi:hypothetical protein